MLVISDHRWVNLQVIAATEVAAVAAPHLKQAYCQKQAV